MNPLESAVAVDMPRFIITEMAMSAVINGLMNIVMVYVVFGGKTSINLFGGDGVAVDLVITAFFISFLMTVMLNFILRKRMASGSAPTITWNTLPRALSWLPRNAIFRGMTIGAVAVVAVVPGTVAALWAIDYMIFDFAAVLVFKAVFGAIFGLAIAPVVILPSIAR